MLPPLNLLALDSTTFDTDLQSGQGIQGTEGDFSTAFADLLQLPPRATPALASLSADPAAMTRLLSGDGQPLPQGGNALPGLCLTVPVEAEPADPEGIEAFYALVARAGAEETGWPANAGAPDARPALPAVTGNLPTATPEPAPLPPSSAHAGIPARAAEPPGTAPAMPATTFKDLGSIVSDGRVRELVSMDPSGETATAKADVSGTRLPQPAAVTGIRLEPADRVQAKAEMPAPAQDALHPAGSDADLRAIRTLLPPGSTSPLPHGPNGAAPASASQVSTAVPALATATTVLPSGDPGWGDALGDRVLWMAGNRMQNAELRLNPAELGPVRVQISVDDGAATINFSAHHPLTRDAIEQALPRLREMLADQGLTLGGASVTEHGVKHDQSGAGRHELRPAMTPVDAANDGTGGETPRSAAPRLAAGLVDVFA